MYKEGYLSVCVFLNVTTDDEKFYDTVIYRKIKSKNGNGFEYKRGTNLKPLDIPILIKLLVETDDFLLAEILS